MITVTVTSDDDGAERVVSRIVITTEPPHHRCWFWYLDKPGIGLSSEMKILQSQPHSKVALGVLQDALNEYLKPGEELQFDGK